MMSFASNALTHATLAVWCAVLLSGWMGHADVRSVMGVSAEPPVPPVEVLSLDLESASPVAHADSSVAPLQDVSPMPALTPAPADPAPVVVAPPGATPAFAVAVTGPVVYEARSAVASGAALRSSGTGLGVRVATPVETLTLGAGAGAQPAPAYPREARRKGREGDVTVRFAVGADGAVGAAQVVGESPWSALNDAAVDTIRTRWRFAPGRERLYEITIRFRLSR